MTDLCDNWTKWLKETRFSYMSEQQIIQTLQWLQNIRDIVIKNAQLDKSDLIIDIGCGNGLLGFKALDVISNEGLVIFADKFQDCIESCQEFIDRNKINKNYKMLLAPCENLNMPNCSVNKALMRSVLVHIIDKQTAINEIYRILKEDGIFSAFEPIIRTNTRYYELVSEKDISDYNDFKNAEMEFMSASDNPLVNFDNVTLENQLYNAGFIEVNLDVQIAKSSYIVKENMVENWMNSVPSPKSLSMKEQFLKYFNEEKVNKFQKEFESVLLNKEITVKSNTVFIIARK